MSTEPTPNTTAERSAPDAIHARWPAVLLVVAALVAFAGASAVVLSQVTVTRGSLQASRTCGSAFDSVVDRTGWEEWWARDLDDVDVDMRTALVRTELCPEAVNRRIAGSVALACAGVVLLVGAAWRRRRNNARSPSPTGSTDAQRITALGSTTWWTGLGLTLAGLIAIVVLVADADSTLFLYTDRVVVGVVGLLVLVPPLALAAFGRVVMLIGEHLGSEESDG